MLGSFKRLSLSGSRFLAVCAAGALIFGLSACTKEKERPKDGPLPLQLGKPGEIKTENTLPKAPNVHVLKTSESIEFTEDGGNAVITHDPSRNFRPGDIIVANSDQRFLVRVKNVKEQIADGRTNVLLRQSQLNEMMKDQSGHIKLEATPKYDLKEIKKFLKYVGDDTSKYEVDEQGRLFIRNVELMHIEVNPGGKVSVPSRALRKMAQKITGRKINVEKGAAGSYRVHLNEARIEIVPTIRSDAAWQRGWIKDAQTRFDTRVKYSIDITYELAGEVQLDAAVDLLPSMKVPIVIGGAVPVYVEVELAIPAGVQVQANGSSTARMIYSAEYDFYAQMNYTSETGVKTVHDQATRVLEKSVLLKEKTAEVKAEFYLKPSVKTRIYRVLGPYAYLQPYVRGELEIPARHKKDDLFVGVGGGVGFEVTEPIFLTDVMDYDSGRIFDFYASWDLDGYAGPAAAQNSLDKPNVVHITDMGNEGFVVLNAKPLGDKFGSRYELITQPDHGILVPSENFYSDGQLYYYPLKPVESDTFVIRVHTSCGQREDITIETRTSDKVRQMVAEERFGKTTNSYKVVFEGSEPFKDQVPHYGIGGGIAVFESPRRAGLLNQCLREQAPLAELLRDLRSDEGFFNRLQRSCGPTGLALLEPIRADFAMQSREAGEPVIPDVTAERASFDFMKTGYNLRDFIVHRHLLGCETLPLTATISKDGSLEINIQTCRREFGEAADLKPYVWASLFPTALLYDALSKGNADKGDAFYIPYPLNRPAVSNEKADENTVVAEAAILIDRREKSGKAVQVDELYGRSENMDSRWFTNARVAPFEGELGERSISLRLDLRGSSRYDNVIINFATFSLELVNTGNSERPVWKIAEVRLRDKSGKLLKGYRTNDARPNKA